jgi:hypothetical protein
MKNHTCFDCYLGVRLVILGNTAPNTSLERSDVHSGIIWENDAGGGVHVASTATNTNGATLRKAAGDTALLTMTVSRNPLGRETNLR